MLNFINFFNSNKNNECVTACNLHVEKMKLLVIMLRKCALRLGIFHCELIAYCSFCIISSYFFFSKLLLFVLLLVISLVEFSTTGINYCLLTVLDLSVSLLIISILSPFSSLWSEIAASLEDLLGHKFLQYYWGVDL